MIYPKEKMKKKKKIFFFLKNLGTHTKVSQEYKYPKRIQYGYDSIFGVTMLYRLKLKTLAPKFVPEIITYVILSAK